MSLRRLDLPHRKHGVGAGPAPALRGRGGCGQKLALEARQPAVSEGPLWVLSCHPSGFSAVVLLKGTPPPPPPGLVPPVSKPPPGFSGLLPGPHPACVPSPTTTTTTKP